MGGWAGHVAGIGDLRTAFKIVVGEPYRKKSLRIRRHRWEDDIKMELNETGLRVLSVFVWYRIGTSGGIL
jgi:hypothetical protein